MDVTTQAIALRSTDVNENDKLILLYSLEYGKITVHAKGIRKSTAKLKFCADQFCFGTYELAKNGDRFTLKTCDQKESFFCLREDVVRYYAACLIAECVIVGTADGQSEPQVFVEVLRAMQSLANETEPMSVALRFIVAFFRLEGSALNWDECSVCGNKPQKVFFDGYRGATVCQNCRTAESVSVPSNAVAVCKMVDGLPYEKLKNVSATGETLKDALTVCGKRFACVFGNLRTVSELVKLA